MVYKIRLEMSDAAVVVDLSFNFNKAFDTKNHGRLKLNLT